MISYQKGGLWDSEDDCCARKCSLEACDHGEGTCTSNDECNKNDFHSCGEANCHSKHFEPEILKNNMFRFSGSDNCCMRWSKKIELEIEDNHKDYAMIEKYRTCRYYVSGTNKVNILYRMLFTQIQSLYPGFIMCDVTKDIAVNTRPLTEWRANKITGKSKKPTGNHPKRPGCARSREIGGRVHS